MGFRWPPRCCDRDSGQSVQSQIFMKPTSLTWKVTMFLFLSKMAIDGNKRESWEKKNSSGCDGLNNARRQTYKTWAFCFGPNKKHRCRQRAIHRRQMIDIHTVLRQRPTTAPSIQLENQVINHFHPRFFWLWCVLSCFDSLSSLSTSVW